MAARFSETTAAILERNGWSVVDVPEGLTLEILRRQGAPFRGNRYFDRFAGEVAETPTAAGPIRGELGDPRGHAEPQIRGLRGLACGVWAFVAGWL